MSAVHSGVFALANRILQIIITFGSLAVLGRLLTPEDFGLFGIVLSIQALFLPLLDIGLTPAYIKLENADNHASNAFFTLNCVMGIFVAACLGGAAPVLAFVYGSPALLPLMLIFAVSVIIRSLSQQFFAALARSKRFDTIMRVNAISLLAGAVAAIAAGFWGLGVWALVIRAHAQGIARFICSRFAVQQRCRFVGWTQIKGFKSSIRFGVGIFIGHMLGGALLSLDRLIFGRIYNVEALGHYTRSRELAQMPDAQIQNALSVPALAHMARRSSNARINSYRILCNVILFIAGVPCLLLMIIGDWVLPWFMGPQWIEAGRYAQIFGLWGLGKVTHGLMVTIYMNEKQIRTYIKMNTLAFFVILFFPIFLCLCGYSALYFIAALSVVSFAFWMSVLFSTLYFYSGNHNLPGQVGWTLLVSTCSALSVGFAAKELLSNQWIQRTYFETTIGIFLVCLLSVLLVISLQFLVNRSQFIEVYRFIGRRPVVRAY